MLLLSGLALLCFAAAAQGAGFSAPQYLSPDGGNAVAEQLAIDSQDRATVVWVRYDDPNDTIGRIQSVRLGADGTPGTVQTLSDSGQGASVPQLAIDSQDRATVVWVRSDGTNDRIQSVRLDADGTPGAVQTLSGSGQDASAPQLAIDSQDRATVVWSRSDGTNRRIQSVRLAADGTPGAVQNLSAAGKPAFTAGVAVDSQDRATVAWGRADETLANTFRVQVVRLDAAGTPGTVHETPDSIHFAAPSTPKIAVDSQDRATVAWSADTGMHTQVTSWRLDADSNPGPEQYLSSGGDDSGDPQLSVDSQDRATVVWVRSSGTDHVIQSVRLGGDGTPGTVQTLSGSGLDSSGPQLAIDSQDGAIVVWSAFIVAPNGGASHRVQSVRLGSDGSPGPLQWLTSLGPSAWQPQVVTDSQDVATVVTVRAGLNRRIQFQRSGDTAAPDTQIDSGPAEGSTVTDPSPTITFSGSPANWVEFFQCKVDTEAFDLCSSPLTLGPLASGAHTFEVRTVETGMHIDATPATLNFTVADPPSEPSGSTGTGQTAGQVAASAKCKKIKSHKRRKKCAKRAKSRHL
jgi:hypothetical protein